MSEWVWRLEWVDGECVGVVVGVCGCDGWSEWVGAECV